MRKGSYSDEQIVSICREVDQAPFSTVVKKYGASELSIYTCRKRFGAVQSADVNESTRTQHSAVEEACRRRDRGDERNPKQELVSLPVRRLLR